MSIEIERKYLIRMPDVARLKSMPGCVVWDILQVYLCEGPDGETRRIRRIREDGCERCYYTQKRRISALSCEETETEIPGAEFMRLAKEMDMDRRPIEKQRLRIPYRGQLLEVDIYDFWTDRATLEVELEGEDQDVLLPEWISVVRDVSEEKAYKNYRLACRIPMEELEQDGMG